MGLKLHIMLICLLVYCVVISKVSAQELPAYNTQSDTQAILKEIAHSEKINRLYPDSALRYLQSTLNQSMRINFKAGALKSLWNIADVKMHNGHVASALVILNKSLSHCANPGDSMCTFNAIASAYSWQGKYDEAGKYSMYAIAIAEKNHRDQLPNLYFNYSVSLHHSLNHDKAMEFSNKALSMLDKDKNIVLYSKLLNMKGTSLYYLTRDINQAVIFLDSAISLPIQHGMYKIAHAPMINKGTLLLRSGKPHAALALFFEAKKVADQYGTNLNDRTATISAIGEAYLELKDYKNAKHYFNQAWLHAHQLPQERLFLLYKYTALFEATGNWKKAFIQQKEYMRLKDSIYNKETNSRINELETQYRTAEKDRKITQQKLQLTAKESELRNRNLWNGIFAGTGLLLVIIILLLLRTFRQKQRLQLSEQENIRLKALIDGEEQERQRISVELHDGIGGILSAAKMNFSSHVTEEEKPEKHAKGIQLIDDAYKELRRTAHNLSPELLKSQGLLTAIETFCEKTALAYNVTISFQHFGDCSGLSGQTSLTVYRIIQELVHNILKHSNANHAIIQLSYNDDLLNITVEDDGDGFRNNIAHTGIGLKSIKSRVQAMKGNMDIDSRPGEGTTIYIELQPVN